MATTPTPRAREGQMLIDGVALPAWAGTPAVRRGGILVAAAEQLEREAMSGPS
ncbi:MAG: hypothetical protein ACRDON_06385 [Gaiellaceae bacterium]